MCSQALKHRKSIKEDRDETNNFNTKWYNVYRIEEAVSESGLEK